MIERLADLRLVIHETQAQVLPVAAGIPWLGFLVYPTHRLVKARKVRNAHRRLRDRVAAYHAGTISYGELEASIRGWIASVAHADSWGLRQHVLDSLVIRPAEHRRALLSDAPAQDLPKKIARKRRCAPLAPPGGGASVISGRGGGTNTTHENRCRRAGRAG